MICISPLSLVNPNGHSNADRLTVPCGKCAACLGNKRSEWTTRLKYELKYSSSAHFVTLTYSDQFISETCNDYGNYCVNKTHIQKFMKLLRKTTPNKLRYYLVAEYGSETQRPHYHLLLFNHHLPGDQLDQAILKAWKYGNIHIGSVTPESISYCTKYCISAPFTPEDHTPIFALMSRNPGIGNAYIQDMETWHSLDNNRFYSPVEGGNKTRMPRYYRDKIYGKSAREHYANKVTGDQEIKETQQFQRALENNQENVYLHNKREAIRAVARSLKSKYEKGSKL